VVGTSGRRRPPLLPPLRSTVEEAAPSTSSAASSPDVDVDVEEESNDDNNNNKNKNVEQIKNTSRDKVMTFSYDMSLEPAYEKPTYPGTGNGMSGAPGEYDIIVIGSGMGGLSCAALSAKYGSRVLCLESHIKVGGSAHTFSRMHDGGKYSFEVGPSIFEGLDRPSLNPLRMIFDALEETMPVKTYKGLGYWTPTGYWRFPIGSREGFERLLMDQCGEVEGARAVGEWNALRERLRTLGGSTTAVSLLNLRQDAGFLATTAGSLPFVLSHPDVFTDLSLTFDDLSKTVDQYVTVPFLRNFIDTMCIFCGFPAKGAMTAHLLYILERFFEETAAFSVPIGGTCELGNTLQRGLEKFGGKLQLNAHVDEILIEGGRAVGVRLKNGSVIKARKAVVSNATPFDTVKLMPAVEGEPRGLTKWRDELGKLPRHGAISHLFLAIDATGLDLSHIDDPAHLVVQVSSRVAGAAKYGRVISVVASCMKNPTFHGREGAGGDPSPLALQMTTTDNFLFYFIILATYNAHFTRTGTALSRTPRIYAPSSSRPYSTRPCAPRGSTSSTSTPRGGSRTNRGRSSRPVPRSTNLTRRSASSASSEPWSVASPTSEAGSSSASSAPPWPTRRSCGGIAARTAWPGRPDRARRSRAYSGNSCRSRSRTSRPPSTACCGAGTRASPASARRARRRAGPSPRTP